MVSATETTIGTAYKVPNAGTIKRIKMSFYQGVIDKSNTGTIKLSTDQQKGPFEYAVGGASGITTTSGATAGYELQEIEVSIPVKAQEEITLKGTFVEIVEDLTVHIMWE